MGRSQIDSAGQSHNLRGNSPLPGYSEICPHGRLGHECEVPRAGHRARGRIVTHAIGDAARLIALDDADIVVLDHPLNHKHGRAPQLRLWGLQSDGARAAPTLLVVAAGSPLKSLVDLKAAAAEPAIADWKSKFGDESEKLLEAFE